MARHEVTVPAAVPPMNQVEMARQLMEAVRRAGGELVFGVPGGGSNLDVVGAAEAAGARFVLTHGESAAATMAGVVGELTGAPGVCVVTRGPGAASAVNGVAQCLLDRQPMLLVTDCVSAADRERVSHQRLDQRALLAPVTKASWRYGPRDVERPTEAVALALAGRPGPVHLDLDSTAPPSPARTDPPGAGRQADLGVLRDALTTARRPVVVAGVGAVARAAVDRTRVASALAHFLDGTGIPVVTTYKARGLVGDSRANAAGLATGATLEAPLLHQADLVLGLGLDPVELIPAPWPYAAPVVLAGPWPIDDSTYFGDRLVGEVVGDLASVLETLAPPATAWEPGAAAVYRSTGLARLRTGAPPGAGRLAPQAVVTIAREEAPAGTIATVDSGAHMLVAMPLWAVDGPGELLISSGLATMGFALPAAIAVALVAPERHVVCFTGDGGLGMVLAELETLARLNLNVVVVVFDDASLSLIAVKQRPEGHGDERAVRYSGPDFSAVAAGCGLAAGRAGDAAGYRDALRRALGRQGPTLLDVAVDPSGYGPVLDAIRGAR
jgi:acetolactate synthase-1/2/3 large subunit